MDEPVVQPEQEKEDPKNFGGQDCDILVEPVPLEMLTPNAATVSLGGKDDLLSAERYKN